MKPKSFFFLLIAFLGFSSCNTPTGYKVEGSIDGLGATKVFMQQSTDSGFVFIDSVVADNGRFIFTGSKVAEPFKVTLLFNSIKQQKEFLCSSFFLENSEIELAGSIRDRARIKISGSKETDADMDITRKAGMSKRYIEIQNIFFKAQINNRSIPVDSVIDLRKELSSLEAIRKSSLTDAVKEHADTYAALYTVMGNTRLFTPQELKQVHGFFSEDIKGSSSYEELTEIVKSSSSVSIGSKFQDFYLSDTTGKKHESQALKGRYVFVDFWASWCAPCRKQMPALRKIYEENRIKGLEIVGVSIDKDENKWKKALNQEQMPWLNLVVEGEHWAKEKYLISSIPANFLLDGKGNIIGKDLSMVELQSTLEQLPD